MPQTAHAHDEHVFVMGAVEHADVAALGQVAHCAPQVVVRELFLARRLEVVNLDGLRVQAAHGVLDGSVLTGGVHGLNHDDDAFGPLGGQLVLKLFHALDVLGHQLFDFGAFGFVDFRGCGVIGEFERSLAVVAAVTQLHHGDTFRMRGHCCHCMTQCCDLASCSRYRSLKIMRYS